MSRSSQKGVPLLGLQGVSTSKLPLWDMKGRIRILKEA